MAVNSIIEKYYEAFVNQQPSWKDLISEEVTFESPSQKTDNLVDFIALSEQFQQFVKEAKLLRRVVENNTVCSEFEYTVSTPAGGILTFKDAEFAEVKDGKITAFTVYFDPTEFARAFGVNAATSK